MFYARTREEVGRIQILKIVNSPFLISHRVRAIVPVMAHVRPFDIFSTNITPSRLVRLLCPMEKSFPVTVNVPLDGWDALEVYSPGYGFSWDRWYWRVVELYNITSTITRPCLWTAEEHSSEKRSPQGRCAFSCGKFSIG